METRFKNFITALQAEQIKKRGTGYYWTSAIMGAISPLLYFVVRLVKDTKEVKSGIPQQLYADFFEQASMPFAGFFFPLLIIITASRITQIDHKNGGWQLMETQPSFKFSIYFSKFTTLYFANILAVATYIGCSFLCAGLLPHCITLPKNTLTEVPWLFICQFMVRLSVGALLISSLQYVISVLIPSFVWSILIGFFGMVLAMFLSPFQLTPVWFPFEILTQVSKTPHGSQVGHFFLYTEYLGMVISSMLLYVGFSWYRYKKLWTALSWRHGRLFTWIGILGVGLGLCAYLMKPNQMQPHSRTVICGHIESPVSCNTIVLRDYIVMDTIANIPVRNNQFHYVFSNKVVPDYYECIIDGKVKKALFFGSKDSLSLEIKMYDNQVDAKINGTRLAENQMKDEHEFSWSSVQFDLQQNFNLDQPDYLSKQIYEEWKEELQKPMAFRTIDNYIPQPDFIKRDEKLVTTKYVNLWEQLVYKRKSMFPNQPTRPTPGIVEMKKSLSLHDESMLSDASYFNYVVQQLISNNRQPIEENQKALLQITALKQGSFREKLLFWQLRKSLEDANSSAERQSLAHTYIPQFNNPHYQLKMTQVYHRVESLSKGQVAPDFLVHDVEGKTMRLADFKGKYLVIDVWATWCGPCKQQAPYFEKLALKYKSQKVQFVSISVDEDVKAWFVEAKAKAKNLLQLHVVDKGRFSKTFQVESIPRFMLIDPNGKFINARMVQPQDDAFEVLLRKALGLPDEE